uniref:histidine kinase dimerization/phospho-acceptor domain-containing protein n=1 Tax=Enterocloster clostridioformis TaxID=1531 RepID=UPI0026750B1D|nr:histidine kinase dimerization/phospho-acceptor domain-containing protein [Enterocloster clostridioformis]
MKSLMRIYFSYIATALAIIVAFVVLQVVLLGIVTSKLYEDESGGGKYAIARVYQVLLDDTGTPVWNYRLPEHLNHTYTTSQVASFTRWYLDDYPVYVWGGEKGLLVIGYPRGSMWNYAVHQDMDNLKGVFTFLSLSFVSTLAASVLILLVSGFRYDRRMRIIADAIGQLASGGSAHLAETGTMKEIASTINRTSDRLTAQREQLEKRDEARTEWISGVSHDIRTPLSLVMGYADMIERQSDTDTRIRKKAALIRGQSVRIRNQIEDLNLASKLEYNAQPLRKRKVFLAVILRKVAADLLNSMEQAERYPLSICIEPGFETFSLEADEQLLFRAFRNILGNSVRHNEDGCSLGVRAWMKDSRPHVRFYDNGRGIPPAICHYLNGGGGHMPEENVHLMGLRIVRQIKGAHGGTICTREDGHGIEIRFQALI